MRSRKLLNPDNMPIMDMLRRYASSSSVRFHMPGHKAARRHRKFYGKTALWDITELSFSDNLLSANSAIKRSEDMCAQSQHCQEVKYCTCGSTVAILALLHSIKGRGTRIIVQRNSHKSVFGALKLSKIEPYFIDTEDGQPLLKVMGKAVEECPDAFAALVTVPDYYGTPADLKAVARIVKSAEMLLLVDAAHGAHINYILPAFYAHADAYVCSAHKTLPALTQASFVCFNNKLLFGGFCRSLNVFHTSSPSYIMLAGLDYARAYMDAFGKTELVKLKAQAQHWAKKINALGFKAKVSFDGIKMTVMPGKFDCAAYNIADYLESKDIYAEFSGDSAMLLMLSPWGNCAHTLKRLYRALVRFERKRDIISCVRTTSCTVRAQRAMPFLQATEAEWELVPVDIAAGRIAACEAGVYPPATPAIVSGEILSPEICAFLTANKDRLFGTEDGFIRVVAER